jgi:hypothetical protein
MIFSGFAVLIAVWPGIGAHAQVKLEPKYTEGTFSSVGTVKFSQVLNVANMEVKTGMEQVTTTAASVGKRDANGKLRVTQKTEALRVRLELPGNMKLDFDSSKPAMKTGDPNLDQILEVFSATTGSAYTLVLNSSNQLEAVEGTETIIDRAPDAARESLRRDYSLDRLRQVTAQSHAMLPEKAVQKGDTWTRTETMQIGGGQTLTFETAYEYGGTAEKDGRTLDRVRIIHTSVKYDMKAAPNAVTTVLSSDLKVESSSGAYLFDRQVGRIRERSVQTRVKGPMVLSVNGMELPVTVDLTIETGSMARP